VAKAPARLRSAQGKAQQFRTVADTQVSDRPRRATANRVLTVLKALLNHAWREGKVESDDAWRRVAPFRQADAARLRYLTQAECLRLVNASDPEFRPLVQVALYTGCRYGELTRMAVADFNPDSGTVTVSESKSGKPRHVVLDAEGQTFFAGMTAGRPSEAPIFAKDDGSRWGRSHQARPLADACKWAKIEPAASFHILRHTYASHLVMKGAPLQVIARNLGHADTRMVERHYAHLAPDHVADAIRAATPAWGVLGKSKVINLQ
jgi:integrase